MGACAFFTHTHNFHNLHPDFINYTHNDICVIHGFFSRTLWLVLFFCVYDVRCIYACMMPTAKKGYIWNTCSKERYALNLGNGGSEQRQQQQQHLKGRWKYFVREQTNERMGMCVKRGGERERNKQTAEETNGISKGASGRNLWLLSTGIHHLRAILIKKSFCFWERIQEINVEWYSEIRNTFAL